MILIDEEFCIVVEDLNSILNISLLTGMSSNTINKSCYVRTTNLPLAILYCTKITKEHFLVFRIFSEFEQINSAKNGICFFTFSIIVFLFKKQEKFINFLCESWIIFLGLFFIVDPGPQSHSYGSWVTVSSIWIHLLCFSI